MPIFRNQPTLLNSFRRGERVALESVYRAYVRSVERYLRVLAGRSGAGELRQSSAIADLLQEVFVRAFSVAGRKGYDGNRPYTPYLTTIARNCFIDAQRTRGREVPTSPDDLSLAVDDRAELDPGWCDPKTAAVVTAFVRNLGPKLKGVYEQRFVLGHSQEVASSELGQSRRSIRTAENRLRVGLRKALVRAGISLRELREVDEDLSTRIPAAPVSVKLENQP
jgi:RNA polymerase sigma factor (sigma-70 family)